MLNILAVAIVKKIYINKIDKNNMLRTTEEILIDLKRKININIYDIIDKNNMVELKLKEDLMGNSVVNLIEQISIFFDNYAKKIFIQEMQELKKLNRITYKNLKEIGKKITKGFRFIKASKDNNNLSYLLKDYKIKVEVITMIEGDNTNVVTDSSLCNFLREQIINNIDNQLKTAMIIICE